jgi:phosphohistidine swiveling domain-containing protein
MLNQAGFTPPGPGVWELEATHMSRPLSRVMESIFPDAATEGFRWSMERYGMLLECMEFKVVNRFVYLCARGVGAPKGAKGPPPQLLFKLLLKLHPEVKRRLRTVDEVFRTRRWREDVERWDNDWKPAIERENTALQGVEVGTLSDSELSTHLGRCIETLRRAVTRHHSLNATAMLPIGDFLVHVQRWSELPPSAVLPLFRGASKVSQGATEELGALATAIREHPDAATLLANSDAAAIVEALLTRGDAVGTAAKQYLAKAGVRIATGYDVADLMLSEMPALVVETIRAAVAGHQTSSGLDVAEREAALRAQIPADHRTEFDALLNEARLTYRVRDERTYLNDMWSAGIARTAILETGRRLVARGLLRDATHAVELTPPELLSMLNGDHGPDADTVAAHAHYRTAHTTADAPLTLGGTPAGPPPAEWLPNNAARAQRAIGIVLGEMFGQRARDAASAHKVRGFGASPGVVTGTARLVLDPADMGRVRKGELLVTRSTSPAFNALLPLIAGVVTDRGGTLSHAAVVAREYGIPAVVGTGNATELIRDGMQVRIDGGTGTVEILA